MYKLAINGGKKLRTKPFPMREVFGKRSMMVEFEKLLYENKLSMFRGNWIQEFYGGEWVNRLEQGYKDQFDIEHAIAVNSATSGLMIACHTAGLGPGDEVIVTPWSMSCSATAPIACGATPVFADIEKDYFCLDPESVREKITERTKAIIVVDLFGQGYSAELDQIAEEYNLIIIEDAAQAIGGKTYGEWNGTRGHMGVFSFTQGKHISAGEGGVIVTDSDELAFKCQLVRNHADAVQGAMLQNGQTVPFPSLLGYNLRMTEVNAMIAWHQTAHAFGEDNYEIRYIYNRAVELSELIEYDVPVITAGKVREGAGHSYYVTPFLYDDSCGVHRNDFIEAVKAELSGEEGRPDKGVPIGSGYVMPLYKLPIFRTDHTTESTDNWNVEQLQANELFLTTLPLLSLTAYDIEEIVGAFKKVYENLEELK